MRFDSIVTYLNGVATPDPIAAPETILDSQLVDLPDGTRRVLLALEAPAAEAITADVWAMLEPAARPGVRDSEAVAPADRVFFQVATGVTLTGGVLTEITAAVPPGGVVYVEATADTLTVPRDLLFRGVV